MATTVANRVIKARPKASPDRIQENISNDKVIREQRVDQNDLLHVAETEELNVDNLPAGQISVPLNIWLENKAMLKARKGLVAVQIAADEAPETLADDLADIDIVVLPFVHFVDGRSYSHAHKLRMRYEFVGEIRAIGDVKFDHLHFLARVGCDAFELAEGADYQTALRAFNEFSEVYQPATDGAPLIFSRRRVKH